MSQKIRRNCETEKMGVEFIYFDVQGRGTQFRLCMDIAGLDYTNTYVPCAEWQSVKADFEQDGLGQLPILKVMVSQTTNSSWSR